MVGSAVAWAHPARKSSGCRGESRVERSGFRPRWEPGPTWLLGGQRREVSGPQGDCLVHSGTSLRDTEGSGEGVELRRGPRPSTSAVIDGGCKGGA